MGRFGNVEAAMAGGVLSKIRGRAAVARCATPTDLRTWIGTWLPCSLHFGGDPLRPVRDARFLPCNASFGARTSRAHIGRTRQLLADFKDDGWLLGLGEFDAIVTHQAVHELRHKKHATTLHRSARTLLRPRGVYLVSDHYVVGDGMSNASLYMNMDEQRAALEAAGFLSVERLLEMKGLVLHRARLYG
jgi:hypothetical protein